MPIEHAIAGCNDDPITDLVTVAVVAVDSEFDSATSILFNNLIGIVALSDAAEVAREVVLGSAAADEVHVEPWCLGIFSVAMSSVG